MDGANGVPGVGGLKNSAQLPTQHRVQTSANREYVSAWRATGEPGLREGTRMKGRAEREQVCRPPASCRPGTGVTGGQGGAQGQGLGGGGMLRTVMLQLPKFK